MAKGITCTCGHSWNKSDSSKKDMNVCHICGKDNTMKDGGWLDKYDEGGEITDIPNSFNNVKTSQFKNINQGDVNRIKNEIASYINSPLYAQRQAMHPEEYMGNSDFDFKKPEYFQESAASAKRSYRLMDLMDQPSEIKNIGTFGDYYSPAKKKTVLNKSNLESVVAHELGHSLFTKHDVAEMYSDYDNSKRWDALSSGKEEPFLTSLNRAEVQKFKDFAYPIKNWDEHYDKDMWGNFANESYADLTGVRHLLYKHGITKSFGEKINRGILDEALKVEQIKNDPTFKRMQQKYSPGKIILLNNTIAQNDSPQQEITQAEYGAELNYNNSTVSYPPDFVGDGYSNVGRNYSPAWGGQFEDGGTLPQYQPGGKVLANVNVKGKKKQPIIVTDPNDPRLKAYNDSLSLYNESKNTEAKLAKILANAYKRTGFDKSSITQALNEGKDIVLHPEKYVERGSLGYIKKYNKKGLYYESVPGEKYLGTSQSPATIKDLIKYNKEDIKERIPYLNSLDEDINGLTNRERIESAKIASASLQKQYEIMKRTGYNPTYFIPNAERSPNLIFKKPTQPVIYEKPKPIPTSQAVIDWIEGNGSSEEFFPEVEQPTNVNPFGFVEDRQTGYMHRYRTSTGELEQPFKGGQTFVDPKNPQVNPKPKMAMGGSMPGAVGFTYARTIGPPAPSNGKYAKKTMASAQNGMEMKYYQEGLDFKPKSISKDGGWLSKYEEGGVIQDDMGQWAHPGEITEIGSNQITMQGVPYPVMGVSDTGDTQMMYPNQEYQYEGSSVTEYPMMAQGGQLTKLDQLTNFTNYNTKQPGGWLDKYQ